MQRLPLHICIVTSQFPALTETFITTKVLELCRRGHKVTVIKNGFGQVNASHLPLVKQAGVEVLSFTDSIAPANILSTVTKNSGSFIRSLSVRPGAIKKNFKTNLQLALLKKHRFDIIHFEFSGLALTYLETMKQLSAIKLVSCRGTAEKVKPLTEPGRAGKLKELFRYVDAIHCVSDDMASSIAGFVDDAGKIFVNRPSINSEVFKRTKAYHQHETMQLLSIGRFTFQKGYLLGLLAARQLKDAGISFSWKIVGDGPQSEEMIYHIHTLGLATEVELLGKKNRDEILELYQEADVFFLPSVYEGIANVCLEAMAMELPVVSTRSGGMEEVIDHGADGLLASNYNPGSMAEQLTILSGDFNLRSTMGKQARKKVVESFSLAKQVDVFEEHYYRLVNSRLAQTI